MIFLARRLRWHDVDPRARSFDASAARAIAERLVMPAAKALKARAPVDRDALEAEIDRALVAEYGAWVAGWNWAGSEPGGGGPVREWCCPRDSLLRPDDGNTDPGTTIDHVVAAVEDWQAFLLELDGEFTALHEATRDQPLARAAEHAAGRLLTLVLERTGAEDAWYATFGRVLTWYLEARGVAPERVGSIVQQTICGRFASWEEPDAATAKETCEALGDAVATAADAPVVGLTEWLTIRGKAFTWVPAPRARTRVAADGHRRYIEGPEHARDPVRARRMADALESARAAARHGTALDFALLSGWQQTVLGVPTADFRTADAFAKQGRERYVREADTRARFELCLAEANDASVSPAVRAARVYLDVCFFHPFADGNGRAARLALDYVLTRETLMLDAIEPLITVSRAANDHDGAWSLAYAIELLVGPRP